MTLARATFSVFSSFYERQVTQRHFHYYFFFALFLLLLHKVKRLESIPFIPGSVSIFSFFARPFVMKWRFFRFPSLKNRFKLLNSIQCISSSWRLSALVFQAFIYISLTVRDKMRMMPTRFLIIIIWKLFIIIHIFSLILPSFHRHRIKTCSCYHINSFGNPANKKNRKE